MTTRYVLGAAGVLLGLGALALGCGGSGEGVDALVEVDVIAPGAECSGGGVLIRSGQDLNRNGVLEADETTSSEPVCSGGLPAGFALASTDLPVGDATCPTGGTHIEVGVDDNDNGVLDPAEVDDVADVCNPDPMAEARCTGAQPLSRVSDLDEPGSDTYVVILRDVLIDQRAEAGQPADDAPWRSIGYNLDGYCTTTDAPYSECTPAQGLAVELDGEDGIDNTFGNSFFPVLSLGADGIDTDLIATQEQGIGAVLLLIDDWNGELNDSRVTVTVTQTVFGTTAGPGGAAPDITIVGSEAFLADGTTPAPLPSWDGTDYFWGREDTFVAGDPALPNVRVTTAYVTNGVLVARLPDRTPIKLVGTDIGVEITLTELLATGNVYDMFFGSSTAPPRVVVAGRWGFNDMVAQSANVGICQGTSLFRTLTTILNGMIDVLQDPPDEPDPNLPCDALSVGIAFDAYVGRFGGVAEGQNIPSPCPAP